MVVKLIKRLKNLQKATKMTEKLLPCPFCGNADIKVRDKSGHYGLSSPYIIKWQASCDHCCADINAPSKPEVIARWNTRQAAQQVQVSEVLEFCYTSFGKMRKCDHLDQQIAESSQNMIKATLAAIQGGGK